MPRNKPDPLEQILEIIATTNHYAIGDFLVDLFCETGRSEHHGKMLAPFLRGETTFGVGNLLKQLDAVSRQFVNHKEPEYTLVPSYKSLKSGRAATTSFAAQKVHDQLLVEQAAAADPNGGLHVFAPHKKTEPIKLRLNWDTYGATTFDDIQSILMKHQPLTFNLIRQLALPENHNPKKEYRYRPPNYVHSEPISHVPSDLTHGRLQRRFSPR